MGPCLNVKATSLTRAQMRKESSGIFSLSIQIHQQMPFGDPLIQCHYLLSCFSQGMS